MNFKKWVKIIQTAGYNGERTVNIINGSESREVFTFAKSGKKFTNILILIKLYVKMAQEQKSNLCAIFNQFSN